MEEKSSIYQEYTDIKDPTQWMFVYQVSKIQF